MPVATQRQQELKGQQVVETGRHNLKTEDVAQQNADTNKGRLTESGRHNLKTEDTSKQNADTNAGRATETGRHNLKTEGQTDTKIKDTRQHRKATEPVERVQGGYRFRLVSGKWVNTGPVS